MATENPHERAARETKKAALIAAVDTVARRYDIDPYGEHIQAVVALLTKRGWAEVAKAAGVNAPSAKTVKELLAHYKSRMTQAGKETK